MSLEQIEVLTWLFENHKDEVLKTKQAYQLYCDENEESVTYSNFTSIVQKLKTGGAPLVESPEYGKITISDKGRQKADMKVNPKKYESVEKDEDRDFIHWASEELVFFLMENKEDEISEAMASGGTIEVLLSELEKFNFELIDEGLEDEPELFVQALDEAFSEFVEEYHDCSLRLIYDSDSYVRSIGEAKQSEQVNKFMQVEGMIRLSEDLVTRIESADFECTACGERYNKPQEDMNLKSPYDCECGNKKFECIDRHFEDTYEFELSSNDVDDDGLKCKAPIDFLYPGYKENLRTGRRVKLSGYISKEKISKKNPKLKTVFNVVGYQPMDKKTDFDKVDEDVKQAVKEKVEKSSNPFRDFALSIAPQVVEVDLFKKQLAASLIGGTPFPDQRDWGRIHTCCYSNPGMGKSALLDEIDNVFGNIHGADNNSTGVGLTGTATQTEDNRWKIKAGTMVFADKGVLTIDEFDKVGKEDLGSLNTAMEAGVIKINKAAQAKLPARASVIVAGNFKKTLDTFDDIKNHLPEKAVGLSDRFALMSAITDQDTDTVSEAILSKKTEEGSDEKDVQFTEQELVVYRNMAKRFYPKLSKEAKQKLKEFINAEEQVAESKDNTEFRGDSNRYKEDLVDLTLMFARSRFSSQSSKEDAKRAYSLFRECRESLDSDVGDPSVKGVQRNRFAEIKEKYELLKNDDGTADVDDIIEEADMSESEAEEVVEKLKREGELFMPEQGQVQKI